MQSTPFQHQIYLGFSSQQKLQEPTIETTFVGGQPLFLYPPKASELSCQNCSNKKLTFICQIFCPLNYYHTYNRILYILYCEQCGRDFRCLKQQSSKKQELVNPQIELKTIKEYSSEIDSQSFQIKDINKIKQRIKKQINQEIILEKQEEQFGSDQEDVEVQEIQVHLDKLGLGEEVFQDKIGQEKLAELKVRSQNMQQSHKEEKDFVFEEYRKIMSELQAPVLLYSNIPIPYNSQPINPRHKCEYCQAKLTLQLQITQKMLLLSPKLINLDWGSLFVFTCSKSCAKSSEQCLIVQYETDAVKDSQITALKKRSKNRKRKAKSQQKKAASKSKQKEESSKKIEEKDEKEEQGDWD